MNGPKQRPTKAQAGRVLFDFNTADPPRPIPRRQADRIAMRDDVMHRLIYGRPQGRPGRQRNRARSSCQGGRPRGRRVASRSAGGGSSGSDPDDPEPSAFARRPDQDHLVRSASATGLAGQAVAP